MGKVRVMVVDDEPSVRRFLRRSLMVHGYEMLEATTGEEALNLLVLNQPDLVILDLGPVLRRVGCKSSPFIFD
jgi:two-component system KDP operon response regulator KdpE